MNRETILRARMRRRREFSERECKRVSQTKYLRVYFYARKNCGNNLEEDGEAGKLGEKEIQSERKRRNRGAKWGARAVSRPNRTEPNESGGRSRRAELEKPRTARGPQFELSVSRRSNEASGSNLSSRVVVRCCCFSDPLIIRVPSTMTRRSLKTCR